MSLLNTIKKKGIIETVVYLLWTICYQALSFMCIALFRIRGYSISFAAHLGQNVFLFQTTKHSVMIDSGTQIGSGVRIKAGFNGKIKIGRNVLIDDYSYVSAHEEIKIGDETMIASHVYIVDFNHIMPLIKSKKNIAKESGYVSQPITIGKFVWVGTHAVILPGVTIGDGAVIGAGSIVTKSVPAYSVVVGNPAKIVKRLR